MTSLANLESIAAHGLLSRSELRSRGLHADDVADPEILQGRGHLSNSVPFHFMSRTPFDYGVIRNALHRDKKFMYVCVYRSYARQQGWKVIPRHPLSISDGFQLMEWDAGMKAIDWAQLDKRGDWEQDHDCKQSCMAEALSPQSVPFSAISAVFCRTEAEKQIVKALKPSPWVEANPGMFPR